MTDGKEIKQHSSTRQPRNYLVGAVLLILLGIAAGLGIAKVVPTAPTAAFQVQTPTVPVFQSVPTVATPRPLELGPDTLYIIDPNASSVPPLDGLSRILALDPETGEVLVRFWTGYRPAAALSPDGRYLYVVDSYFNRPRVPQGDWVHGLTTFDTQTREVTWEITLPGERHHYLSYPAKQYVWTSVDGRWVYVLMSATSTRLVKVDTSTRQVEQEIDFGLGCKRIWKLAWSEDLVAACGDRLILLNLISRQQGETLTLPGFDDSSPVPKNMTRWVQVLGGDIAEQTRRLYLVTSRQEVLAVDLGGRPTVQPVLTLPPEWQFATFDPVVVSADGRFVYLGVRRIASPVFRLFVAEEVWVYDTATWQRVGTVHPSGGDGDQPQDQGAFSMALSRDGRWLYTVNPATLTLSIIDTQTLNEVKVIRNLGQPDNFRPAPGWIISP